MFFAKVHCLAQTSFGEEMAEAGASAALPPEGSQDVAGRPSSASRQVLVVHDERTLPIAEKLLEELALAGIEAQARKGTRKDARDAAHASPAGVSVWLKNDEKALVFVPTEAGVRRRVVTERVEAAKTDLLALHVFEVVRGELVSAGPTLPPGEQGGPRDSATSDGAVPHGAERGRRFEFGVSPLIADGSFADLGAVLGVDFGYRVVPRLSLGPYLHLGLGRPSWAREPKQFSASQLGGGGEVRWAVLEHEGMNGRLDARFGLGARSVAIRSEGGKEEDKVTLNTTAVTVGVGAVYSLGLTRSLRLGLTGGYEVGIVVDFPAVPETLGKKEQEALTEAAENGRFDGQLLLGVRLGAEF